MNGFQFGDLGWALCSALALASLCVLAVKTCLEPDHKPPFRASDESENPT